MRRSAQTMKKSSILNAAITTAVLLILACGRNGPIPPPDKLPPKVSSSIPANGSVNVPVNLSGGISLIFSKLMDASSINNQTITFADGPNSIPGSVTYSAASGVPTAVYTPSSALNPTTLYKITVDANVRDTYGIPMGANYISSFSTGSAPDTIPPAPVATTPMNGSIDVMPNVAISVTFSEPIDQQTLSFVLTAESATIPCTMSYAGTTAIFTPLSSLAYSTLYTAMINAGVRDLAGNAMPADYIWSFTTGSAPDTTPPSVTATMPATGAVGVAVNVAPSVTFSEQVDAITINFTLSGGGATIPCTMSYAGTTAIFTPLVSLAYSTLYMATISAGVRDLAGNVMPNGYLWSFMTGTAPDTTPPSVSASIPATGAIGVAVNIAPSVTFTEPINQQTLSFVLTAESVTIPCTMSYAGTTAIFTPLVSLAYSTLYTATISAGVRDLAGNVMLDGYLWSFTTGTAPDTMPPSVTATMPVTGAVGVAVNVAPSVTFTEPIDQQTLAFVLTAESITIPCMTSYAGTTAIFTPLVSLAYSTLYTATISAGVRDLAGNAMPNGYLWSFTTGTAPDTMPPSVTATIPAVGAAGVAVNVAPSVTFSEQVDSTTITFTLSGGGISIPCTMSYAGTTAIFTPSSNLTKNVLYTARVNTGVRDLAGNTMTNDYFWSFTTGKH